VLKRGMMKEAAVRDAQAGSYTLIGGKIAV
jgi:hypothetical protein